jgi:DNA mismatch repair ATPase MutS
MDYVVYTSGSIGLAFVAYKAVQIFVNQFTQFRSALQERLASFNLLRLLVQAKEFDRQQVEDFLAHARELRVAVQAFTDRFKNPDRVIESLRSLPWREVEQKADEISQIATDIDRATRNFYKTCENSLALINRSSNFGKGLSSGANSTQANTNTANTQSAANPATTVETFGTQFDDATEYMCRTKGSNNWTRTTGAQINMMIRNGFRVGRDFYVGGTAAEFSNQAKF